VRISKRRVAELKREGIVRVDAYFDQEKPKIAVAISRPPYTASPENYPEFVKLYVKALMVTAEILTKDILERAERIEDEGLKRKVAEWACRIRVKLDNLIGQLEAEHSNREDLVSRGSQPTVNRIDGRGGMAGYEQRYARVRVRRDLYERLKTRCRGSLVDCVNELLERILLGSS